MMLPGELGQEPEGARQRGGMADAGGAAHGGAAAQAGQGGVPLVPGPAPPAVGAGQPRPAGAHCLSDPLGGQAGALPQEEARREGLEGPSEGPRARVPQGERPPARGAHLAVRNESPRHGGSSRNVSQVVARIFVSRRVTCHSTGRFQAVAWVLHVILIFLYARATGAVAGAVPADKFAAESGGAADDGGRARARHRGAAHRGQ
eukprot:1183069-Prorocentrum_minimum.AAC.7